MRPAPLASFLERAPPIRFATAAARAAAREIDPTVDEATVVDRIKSDHAATFEEALALPSQHQYGNGVAIFTRDGDTARDFVNRVQVGMVGVNFAIPVPLAYYTFGGWKRSGFGDLNQHGPDSVRFYTKTKTVTSRWPTGTKEGAEFVIPTMK